MDYEWPKGVFFDFDVKCVETFGEESSVLATVFVFGRDFCCRWDTEGGVSRFCERAGKLCGPIVSLSEDGFVNAFCLPVYVGCT